MKVNIIDRRLVIWLIFTLVLGVLAFRLAQLTIVEGDQLASQALNLRLKKMPLPAKRGEIYDRNGTLIAGNLTSYSVNFLYDQKFDEAQQRMAIELFTLLEDDGDIAIEMPIEYNESGQYIYATDVRRDKWLLENGFELGTTAEQVFASYRERENIAADVDKYSAQNILFVKGIYLPIRVRDMLFTYDFERNSFLELYSIDSDSTPRQAIAALRERERLSEEYSDKEAYYIVMLKHAINLKGYLKYEPIKIAQNISKKTAIYIQEQTMRFPNLDIIVEPVRYYPQDYLASHILGYLGKISTAYEQEKYNKQNGYQKADLIGKIGIEAVYEEILRGRTGHRYIEVNNAGRYIDDAADKINDPRFVDAAAEAGKNMVLTIDMALQAEVRDYLIKNLDALRSGGTYHSPYGDINYRDPYKNANTGAVVVTDVRTGEVLSMVSYPDYDLNLFARGITYEDYEKLQPDNKRDKLAPRPLFNIATQTAVQPGSTFKMITGFAALQAGLNPHAKYRDAGHITTGGGQTFGCWLWNGYGAVHGMLNLMQAIEVSCNYYFFSVGNGYDYARNVKLPFDVGAEKIIEAAKTFGLDESSGVEIGDTVTGVPNPDRKKTNSLNILRRKLNEIAEDYVSPDIYSDDDLLAEAIDSVLAIGENNPKINRSELYFSLKEIFKIEDRDTANRLTDIVKYDYFNQFDWYEGDTFNLAIGQGEHSYTTVQMARYISAIANGGYLYPLTLVRSIDGEPVDREPYKFIDPNGYITYLKQGMRQVVSGSRGSVKSYFKNFPIEVAAKTGTAEKEGKVQPPDETEYILEYLARIAPQISPSDLLAETDKTIAERTDHIATLYDIINNNENEEEVNAAQVELDTLLDRQYLSRGNAMRASLIALSDNRLTAEQIDAYKDDFDNFTWFVSFAPYDKPEIAVVVLIPQGGSGGYGAAIAKDIYGYYFGLAPN